MKRKLLPLLLVAFLVVAAVVPMLAITAAAETETTTYTFSSYAAGTQYAKNEVHKLDENVTIVTTSCHFTSELRIYSSSTNNGYAIIKSTNPITGFGANAGYKVDTLKIYGSNDEGVTWVEVGSIATESSYKDYSTNFNGSYKWLKLDVAGSNQVRLKSMTLTTESVPSACEHANTTLENVKAASCTEEGYTGDEICDDCGATVVAGKSIDKEPHNYVSGVCSVCGEEEPQGYTLVTNVADLKVGDSIVIVATGYNYALSTTQNGNNRGRADVVKAGNIVTFGNDVQIITLTAGTNAGTFGFYVEGDETGYLYAAGGTGKNNYLKTQASLNLTASWSISIDSDGIATIKSADSTVARNWLRYNHSSSIFSCYGSGQADVAIYKLYSGADECEHTNTTPEHKDATCTEAGYDKVYCEDCEIYISNTPISATGHNLVNGVCANNCGLDVSTPEKIVAAAYALSKGDYLVNSDTKFTLTGVITGYYATSNDSGEYSEQYENVSVYIVVNGDTEHPIVCYRMKGTGADVIAVGDTITVTGSLMNYNDVIEFASGCSLDSYSKPITSPKFDAASMLISNDLTLNYLVKLPAGFDAKTLTVKFTFNGETVEVAANPDLLADGRACFALQAIAPQQIALNVVAELYCGEERLDIVDEYSVKTYIDRTLAKHSDNAELVALLNSVLVYAQAAKDYLGKEGDDITDKTLTGLPQPGSDLVVGEATQGQAAIIFAGGIRFDYNNSLFVKYNAPQMGALVVMDGTEEVDYVAYEYGESYIAYITVAPTDFDKVFEISVSDGTVTHTIKYSVNSYISEMWDDVKFGNLAKATYEFGVAAKAYAEANEDALN